MDPSMFRWYSADMTQAEFFRFTPRSVFLYCGTVFLAFYIYARLMFIAPVSYWLMFIGPVSYWLLSSHQEKNNLIHTECSCAKLCRSLTIESFFKWSICVGVLLFFPTRLNLLFFSIKRFCVLLSEICLKTHKRPVIYFWTHYNKFLKICYK